jgi:hypothetical protein
MLDWINSWSRSAGPLMEKSSITCVPLYSVAKSRPCLTGSDDPFDPVIDDLGLRARGEAQDEHVQAILQERVCMPVPVARGSLSGRRPSDMGATQSDQVSGTEFRFTSRPLA